MEAAYRFFENPKVSPEKTLQPNLEAARGPIIQSDVVLLGERQKKTYPASGGRKPADEPGG